MDFILWKYSNSQWIINFENHYNTFISILFHFKKINNIRNYFHLFLCNQYIFYLCCLHFLLLFIGLDNIVFIYMYLNIVIRFSQNLCSNLLYIHIHTCIYLHIYITSFLYIILVFSQFEQPSKIYLNLVIIKCVRESSLVVIASYEL